MFWVLCTEFYWCTKFWFYVLQLWATECTNSGTQIRNLSAYEGNKATAFGGYQLLSSISWLVPRVEKALKNVLWSTNTVSRPTPLLKSSGVPGYLPEYRFTRLFTTPLTGILVSKTKSRLFSHRLKTTFIVQADRQSASTRICEKKALFHHLHRKMAASRHL